MWQAINAKILAAQGGDRGEASAGAVQKQSQRTGDAVHGDYAGNAGGAAGPDEMYGRIAAGGEHVGRQGLLLAIGTGHPQARHLDCDVYVAGPGVGSAELGDACELLKGAMDRQEAKAENGVADLAVGRRNGQALGQSRRGQAQPGQGDRAEKRAVGGLGSLRRTP